ncbi:MAG: lytic transglycosylase domain-containing protein [Microbacteriaceae bacterium]
MTQFTLASFSTATAPRVSASDVETVPVDVAASDADTTLAAATAVTDEIAASGLDIGVTDTSVDTAALEIASDRLDEIVAESPLFAPLYVGDVVALTATVDERVAGLRGSLDAAKARKAEEEAAEKARLEAEQARLEAEAAAAAKASTRAPAPAPVYATGGGGSGDNSPAGAQASARAMLGNYGWGDDQFGCLVSLWNKESGWNYQAHNSSSGAHGIPQALPGSKMASAGADWQTNAATQVAWGLGYIAGRYGNPCGAWSHSQSVGWY